MEEIEREFIALKNMRQEEAARSQQWRHTLLNSSVPVEPIDNSQNNSELEAKVRQLESELENMKEKSFQNVQTELPGMNSDHMANYQAEVDYTKFAQFETAISDQMDVIEKLTEEKRGISTELITALKLLRQRGRENATLSYQLKEILVKMKAK